MNNPSASLGITHGYGIFSLLLSSNFPIVEFLNTLELLDEPQAPTSTDMKQQSASATATRTGEKRFF
jgi:hypothetical protein